MLSIRLPSAAAASCWAASRHEGRQGLAGAMAKQKPKLASRPAAVDLPAQLLTLFGSGRWAKHRPGCWVCSTSAPQGHAQRQRVHMSRAVDGQCAPSSLPASPGRSVALQERLTKRTRLPAAWLSNQRLLASSAPPARPRQAHATCQRAHAPCPSCAGSRRAGAAAAAWVHSRLPSLPALFPAASQW